MLKEEKRETEASKKKQLRETLGNMAKDVEPDGRQRQKKRSLTRTKNSTDDISGGSIRGATKGDNAQRRSKSFNFATGQRSDKNERNLEPKEAASKGSSIVKRARESLDESASRFIRQYRHFFSFKDKNQEEIFSQSIEENLNNMTGINGKLNTVNVVQQSGGEEGGGEEEEAKNNENLLSRQDASKCGSFNKAEVSRLIKLEKIEDEFIKNLNSNVERFYVKVGFTINIWTVKVSPRDATKITESPAVFIHGLYPGVFLWSNLMDKVSQNRISYYIDLPGFANSSKTVFSESGDVNESAIVNFIEEWRKTLQLEDFSIIAHSFGCYFSFAYCLRFPRFVKKFILIDPWGIYSLNMNKRELNNSDWSKLANPQYFTSKFFSPLAIMRHTGKIAHLLSNAFRQELNKNFKYLPKQTFYDYLEYSSSNDVATGERLFDSVQSNVYFASHPMIERAEKLDTNIELHCLISENSFIRDFHQNFERQMKEVLGKRLKGFEILIDVDDKIITNPKFADHLSSKILC